MKDGSVVFENVTKRYGDAVAVRGVSFEVENGTLCTLLGPSGCGKTTTLRMVAGLELPSEGRILIGGVDVTHAPASARDVSMVFQTYALFPHMNVLENVQYGLLCGGSLAADAKAKALDGLATVGLAGFERRLPSELSGGQQQRVALARALVLEPSVLLFDEPLSNLDAALRRQMREEIRELQQRLKVTAVYVTHDQEEALAVSDRIIVMNRAVIAQSGTPRDLYESPQSLFVARFMGEANLLTASLVSRSGERATVDCAGARLDLPHRGLSEGPVHLAVRPHAAALHPGPGPNRLRARVEKAAYLGDHLEFTLSTGAGALFVVSPVTAFPPRPGEEVQVELLLGAGVMVVAPERS